MVINLLIYSCFFSKAFLCFFGAGRVGNISHIKPVRNLFYWYVAVLLSL